MNDAPIKQPDGAAAELQSTELSTPHFDDTAVAVAQPVEPLPPERFSLAALSHQPIAIVIAFGLVFAITLAGSLFILPADQTKASEPIVGTERSQPEEPLKAETAPAAVIEPEHDLGAAAVQIEDFLRSRKIGTRSRARIRALRTDEDGRPVARKVGELRYGRGSEYR